jgi:hypothetical protein
LNEFLNPLERVGFLLIKKVLDLQIPRFHSILYSYHV